MVVAIDFDGTCVTHEFPKIGKEIGAASVLKELVCAGHKLILYTMRSDGKKYKTVLTEAVQWFADNEIPLYSINVNPTQSWSNSPKVYANLYIDDAALGCPLVYDKKISDRPFVDWVAVKKLLMEVNILPF